MPENTRQPYRSATSHQAAAAQPVVPSTPRKNGVGLNALVCSLESEWQLGLQTRDELQSPSQRPDTLATKVYGQIQRLYYSSGPELDHALASFREIADGFEHSERLKVLHGTLKSKTKSPASRVGTPLSRQVNRNLPPKTLKLATLTTRTYQDDKPESYYVTGPETGSPTDEDEDDYDTPPSPTPLSRPAPRRTSTGGSGSIGSKRHSDSSIDSRTSPKLTRTSKGKPRLQDPSKTGHLRPTSPILFKKPSLDMARSCQAQSAKSSFNTSFNTMWSSHPTQPDTAMTSFTSDGYDADVPYPKLTGTSSTSIDSLEDQDLLAVSAKQEREAEKLEKELPQPSQELTREGSSTSNSIDEDGLLETSIRIETEYAKPPTILPRPPMPTPFQPHNSSPGVSHDQPNIYSSSVSQSPQRPSAESPSKLPYFIRDIPKQNLFVDSVDAFPEALRGFPYFILFICCRLGCENNVTISDLVRPMSPSLVQRDHSVFWETINNHPKVSGPIERDPHKVWAAAKKQFEGYTFKGKFVFNNKKGTPVFNLDLSPIQPERSCRFQRKFGSDRFLYLDIPSFEPPEKLRPSRFTSTEMSQIQERWKAWFLEEHTFLGRKWKAFHVEAVKKKAGHLKDSTSDKRIIMFAIQGIGINKRIEIDDLMNWFFSFSINSKQTFCKAYARFDLGLSRTVPTAIFPPSAIRSAPEILADRAPEDSRFNDTSLDWNERCDQPPVMNDGCSRISVGAARAVWKIYSRITDTRDPMPSAFQARFAGAKGIWIISAEPSTNDPLHLEPWIEITPSQLKFDPHEEDCFDSSFDPHRLTFEVVNYSVSPRPSELHISFIPIMVDRGVPREVLERFILDRLDVEREELWATLQDRVKLYHWVHKHSASRVDPERWLAAMPQSLPEKIKLLLESGFSPADEPYLANVIHRFIKQKQIWMEQRLRIPSGKSTFLFGVVDPHSVLQPGEVHVDFSTPFVDEQTGETYRTLSNLDLLVARQPACRRSDVQKVRVVKRPELSHLVDVVVFPMRGEYPIAGKLQGGDYDGDTFWLCWEPSLVAPFKNAPAPLQALDPAKYDIKTDERKVYDVMDPSNLSTIHLLLKEALDFRMIPSLLGIVTNFLDKQAYRENQVFSGPLNTLCDMHDLLVDASKQGFVFSRADYSRLTQRKLRCGNPKVPAYKRAMEDCKNSKDIGETDKVRERNYKHNRENVLDYLYFDVIRKHDVATLKMVKDSFPKQLDDDRDLRLPYTQLRSSDSEAIKNELAILVEQLKIVDDEWATTITGKRELTSEHYTRTIQKCYDSYRSIMPTAVEHEDIQPWLFPYLDSKFSLWEFIRASALYTENQKRHPLVWHMAGKELARLKCGPIPGSKFVTGTIFSNLKPKPTKVPKQEEEDSEDEFQSSMDQFLA